ncbi:uncharacterized protein Fot_40629 [Forsythia ovata]|uniref:Uncharacterized protein n=1 Tax=Forsythia ovata TaxID=205694 RepID=A0ABD1S7Z7_9LAMI
MAESTLDEKLSTPPAPPSPTPADVPPRTTTPIILFLHTPHKTDEQKKNMALYASGLLGIAFGILSVVAALAVAVPATLVTWITVLVFLTFCGKPRRDLVLEGKKLTAEITGFVIKILIKEGNVVAALCAVLGYFALVRNRGSNSCTEFE